MIRACAHARAIAIPVMGFGDQEHSLLSIAFPEAVGGALNPDQVP